MPFIQTQHILLYLQHIIEFHLFTRDTLCNQPPTSLSNLTPNTLVSDITVSTTTESGEDPAAVITDNITTLSRPG